MGRKSKMLKVGTRVRWTSQSGGYEKTKEGVIVETVLAYESINDMYDKQIRHGLWPYRDHESYIVKVGNKLYWPLVKYLEVRE